MESGEFPVGRLLNGDSYKTQTRMKNISSAMNWIQKQMETLRESDKQLFSLFSKLETDMVDLKAICSDGRGRAASVSSVGITTGENSSASLRYLDNFQLSSKNTIEETGNEYSLERSSSNDSLENFADLLGEDDDAEEMAPRTLLKSQGSNFSSEFNSNYSLHDHDRMSGGGMGVDIRGLDDALSMTSQSSGSSTRINVTNSSPHLSNQRANKDQSYYSSNDSGALVDTDVSSITTTGNENAPSSITTTTTVDNSLTSTLTEKDKRLSDLGLAGEIFAILNMK